MNAEAYVDMMAARQQKTIQVGYYYTETKLTEAELAAADPALVKNYDRGILTGGELDCRVRHGCMPYDLN